MHFSWLSWPIDGSIVGLYLLATMIVVIVVRKYVGKVERCHPDGRMFCMSAGLGCEWFSLPCCEAIDPALNLSIDRPSPWRSSAAPLWSRSRRAA